MLKTKIKLNLGERLLCRGIASAAASTSSSEVTIETEKSLATPKTDDRAVSNIVFVISRQTESSLFDIIESWTGVKLSTISRNLLIIFK